MTLTHTEPTLWGSPPGDVQRVELEVSHHDALKRVRLSVHTANRRAPQRLDVVMADEDEATDVIGRCMSLVLRADRVGANLARRTLWAIHNRLGAEGYDVHITGCGRDPFQR